VQKIHLENQSNTGKINSERRVKKKIGVFRGFRAKKFRTEESEFFPDGTFFFRPELFFFQSSEI